MEQYEYWRLVDARVAVDQKVHFYGAVVEYELPRPTTGKDMICTMTVADMSYDSPGLRVVVFGSKDQLPRVRSLYDIIRFHRVKMNVHNGLPQALARKESAFLLFDGSGDNTEPYQASSNTYTFEAHDRQILEVMRAWSCANLSKQVGATQYLLKIRDIKGPPSYFDLCCKVLHLSSETVYVWDGTDSAYTTSLPYAESESLPLSTLREFPSKGTVLEVKVDVPLENRAIILLPQVGRWIKLRNITVRTVEGKFEAVFTRESKFSILAPASEVVQESDRWYKQRISSEDAGLPENCPKPLTSLTVTDFEHVPFSSLRQVVTSPQVTFKFRCLVRVRSISPARVEEFCSRVEEDQCVYCVRLTLQDPTGQIHAYLFGEDGERFFNGFPAAQRDAGDACLGALQRSVERLLHGDSDEPPYVKCCIKSYYLDKQQPWTSRRFRIFGTRFL